MFIYTLQLGLLIEKERVEHAQLWQWLWPLLLTWFNFNPSMDK